MAEEDRESERKEHLEKGIRDFLRTYAETGGMWADALESTNLDGEEDESL